MPAFIYLFIGIFYHLRALVPLESGLPPRIHELLAGIFNRPGLFMGRIKRIQYNLNFNL